MHKSNSQLFVNCNHLKKNIAVLAAKLPEGMEKMAVIKSNAYGHGAVEVARTLEPLIDAFAVNDIREAVELREHDIKAPVLVFAPPYKSTAKQYRRYNLTATISSIEHFDMLPPETCCHLNFDTGMGRFGFKPRQTGEVVHRMKSSPHLDYTGLYTHFATADEPSPEMVKKQQERFENVRSHFPPDLKVHVANTGGAAFYSFHQYDMVRLGIGMYGYPPGKEAIRGLQPVLSWRSRLVAVNQVKRGDCISYGAAWKCPRQGYVGVLPVGYEDGLRRGLSGQLSVLIDGKEYEVAGTITMNYCMIFLGDQPFPKGTEAELLYDSSNAVDWAHKTGTIPYEILTGIGRNIPRTYIK